MIMNRFVVSLIGLCWAIPAVATSPYPSLPLYLNQKTVKPNIALLVDDSGSMLQAPNGESVSNSNPSKITIARGVLSGLINNNWDMAYWSLFHFRYGDSSGWNSYVPLRSSLKLDGWSDPDSSSSATQKTNFINDIKSSTPGTGLTDYLGTPSAGAFYNLMKSFAGKKGWNGKPSYESPQDYTGFSPIKYVCQKNFVIFISDGYPNDEVVDATEKDKYNKSVQINNYSPIGVVLPAVSRSVDTRLIRYASFYYQNGIVPSGVVSDLEGNTYDASNAQPITTYAIGFGLPISDDGQKILNATAQAGGGLSFNSTDSDSLTNSLKAIINSIKSVTASDVPIVSSQPKNPTEAFQATFYSGDWSGQVKAYKTKPNGLVDLTSSIPVFFNTASANSRSDTIFSSSKAVGGGAQFKTMANTVAYTVAGNSSDLMSYLAGISTPAGWRDRSSDKSSPNTLGDVIDSTPIAFGASSPAGFAVGANDGMLHVFSRTLTNYTESFSYIPRAVQPNLMSLGKKTYGKADPHLYFVNGALTFNNFIGDGAQFDAKAYSILTGSLAQGGQGIFALDISDPIASKSFSASGVLWDHTSSDTGFANLGYTFSTPVVAQVYVGKSKKWAVITGNGYDSTGKKTSLMVIDLKTGDMLYEIDTGTASNGLSSPVVLDKDNDMVVDYVYAGDQSGNVWRFKLQTATDSTTSVTKFFTTQSNQPVTGAPAIYKVPAGGYMVYVGTGRMMYEKQDDKTVNDRTITYPQSLYGIYDDLTKSNLTYSSTTFIQNGDVSIKTGDTASIDGSATSSSGANKGASVDFRETTPVTISDSIGPSGTKSGWIFNMNATNGERMIYQPIVALGRLYFTTQVLKGTDKVCSNVNQQSGWAMALDLMTGGAPSAPAFDLNGDGKLNSSATSPDGDVVTFSDGKTIAPAGIDYHVGIPSVLAVTFTVTDVNLGDYLTNDSGQLGTYPYPSSASSKEVLNFHIGGTGGTNGNAAAGKLLPGAVAGGGRRIAWRELF